MTEVIWFGFGVITIGVCICGLFAMFESIIHSVGDDKAKLVDKAFKDGFAAGVYQTRGPQPPVYQESNRKELRK